MFRKLCKKPTFLLYRQLHDSKLPSIEANINFKEPSYIGTESPKKYDYCNVPKKQITETPEELRQRINNKDEYDDEYPGNYRED